jgi:hypothetical protein
MTPTQQRRDRFWLRSTYTPPYIRRLKGAVRQQVLAFGMPCQQDDGDENSLDSGFALPHRTPQAVRLHFGSSICLSVFSAAPQVGIQRGHFWNRKPVVQFHYESGRCCRDADPVEAAPFTMNDPDESFFAFAAPRGRLCSAGGLLSGLRGDHHPRGASS